MKAYKLGQDSVRSHPFSFSFSNRPNIRRYTVSFADSVV
jgi:hypothetical protein